MHEKDDKELDHMEEFDMEGEDEDDDSEDPSHEVEGRDTLEDNSDAAVGDCDTKDELEEDHQLEENTNTAVEDCGTEEEIEEDDQLEENINTAVEDCGTEEELEEDDDSDDLSHDMEELDKVLELRAYSTTDGEDSNMEEEDSDTEEEDSDTEEEEEEEYSDMMEEEERDARILRLLQPTVSGMTHEFGKQTVPPLPHLLDHISEGQLPRSEAPFFKSPTEVLAEIIQHLDPKSLASFALVSWDCLQLVRSVRFASVLLDYSDSSIALLSKLSAEGLERSRSTDGTTSQPSIGACIRRLTVATSPKWITRRHDISFDRPMRDREIAKASRFYFDAYLPDLMGIFARPGTLPDLELLDWKDKIALPKPFFERLLALSSLKHLKLFRILVDEEYRIVDPPPYHPGGWPLQTLHLEVEWDGFGKMDPEEVQFDLFGTKAPEKGFCASILRLCAPTLVSLSWQNVSDKSHHSIVAFRRDDLVRFPCLRNLRLGNIKFWDVASLNSLLGANLISLAASTEQTAIHSKCFMGRGTISSLETFVWETPSHKVWETLSREVGSIDSFPLDFLRANPQLSKLSIPRPVPPALLETRVLPRLSASFKSLRSLRLVWKADQIRTPELRIIGTMNSLEQVHLSAGEQSGGRYDLRVDHAAMRKYLGALPNLKRIAFSRDSYDDEDGDGDGDGDNTDGGHAVDFDTRYYSDKYVNWDRADYLDGETWDIKHGFTLTAVWEQLHRQRVLKEAAKYVAVLPELEWLYFGQLPMSVVELQEEGEGPRRAANLLGPERDDCWTHLDKMFGDGVFCAPKKEKKMVRW